MQAGETLSVYEDPERTQATQLTAQIQERQEGAAMHTYTLQFQAEGEDPEQAFERVGHAPLPPYITERVADSGRYQTVFASKLGSAAAPTAGLHLTPELIKSLQAQGVSWAEVTLHVGLGTFLPLKDELIQNNRLHSERTEIRPATADVVNQAIAENRRVVAIGTTSARTLESHWSNGSLRSGEQETDLFIRPGYAFQAVNGLFTNFHLPKSSLLVLLASLIANDLNGTPVLTAEEAVARLQRLYALAIAERYRFYSFGDAMLVL
jgi:S-adenosylmethionine:tRNA ribosyltransferase-isomerase